MLSRIDGDAWFLKIEYDSEKKYQLRRFFSILNNKKPSPGEPGMQSDIDATRKDWQRNAVIINNEVFYGYGSNRTNLELVDTQQFIVHVEKKLGKEGENLSASLIDYILRYTHQNAFTNACLTDITGFHLFFGLAFSFDRTYIHITPSPDKKSVTIMIEVKADRVVYEYDPSIDKDVRIEKGFIKAKSFFKITENLSNDEEAILSFERHVVSSSDHPEIKKFLLSMRLITILENALEEHQNGDSLKDFAVSEILEAMKPIDKAFEEKLLILQQVLYAVLMKNSLVFGLDPEKVGGNVFNQNQEICLSILSQVYRKFESINPDKDSMSKYFFPILNGKNDFLEAFIKSSRAFLRDAEKEPKRHLSDLMDLYRYFSNSSFFGEEEAFLRVLTIRLKKELGAEYAYYAAMMEKFEWLLCGQENLKEFKEIREFSLFVKSFSQAISRDKNNCPKVKDKLSRVDERTVQELSVKASRKFFEEYQEKERKFYFIVNPDSLGDSIFADVVFKVKVFFLRVFSTYDKSSNARPEEIVYAILRTPKLAEFFFARRRFGERNIRRELCRPEHINLLLKVGELDVLEAIDKTNLLDSSHLKASKKKRDLYKNLLKERLKELKEKERLKELKKFDVKSQQIKNASGSNSLQSRIENFVGAHLKDVDNKAENEKAENEEVLITNDQFQNIDLSGTFMQSDSDFEMSPSESLDTPTQQAKNLYTSENFFYGETDAHDEYTENVSFSGLSFDHKNQLEEKKDFSEERVGPSMEVIDGDDQTDIDNEVIDPFVETDLSEISGESQPNQNVSNIQHLSEETENLHQQEENRSANFLEAERNTNQADMNSLQVACIYQHSRNFASSSCGGAIIQNNVQTPKALLSCNSELIKGGSASVNTPSTLSKTITPGISGKIGASGISPSFFANIVQSLTPLKISLGSQGSTPVVGGGASGNLSLVTNTEILKGLSALPKISSDSQPPTPRWTERPQSIVKSLSKDKHQFLETFKNSQTSKPQVQNKLNSEETNSDNGGNCYNQ